MKLFALFGIICFIDPDVGDRRCMNFWEDPVQKLPLEKCIDNVKKKGKEIEDSFMKKGIYIKSLEVYCIPVK